MLVNVWLYFSFNIFFQFIIFNIFLLSFVWLFSSHSLIHQWFPQDCPYVHWPNDFTNLICIIHRSIKPDNICIGLNKTSNKIFIVDFGFAKRYIQGMESVFPISKEKDWLEILIMLQLIHIWELNTVKNILI